MPVRIIRNENDPRNVYYEFDSDPRNFLGEGGMGRVYKGKQVEEEGGYKREREIALKLLFDDLPQSAIDRSRREAAIRIKNDNLVEMIDFVETQEEKSYGNIVKHYHVVSEYLEGLALDDLLVGKTDNPDGQPNLTAQRLHDQYEHDRKTFVGTVFRSILSGVQALHDQGYIHRDIDPSNIMVTSDGKIKLIDFGIARQVKEIGTQDKHLTKSGQFLGKSYYASPELISGDINHQNFTTDVYALGIMLFQLFVGHLPFDGPSHEVAAKQVHDKLPLAEVKDKTLRKIIEKATEKQQQKRYQSAAELRVAIDGWMNEKSVPSSTNKPMGKTIAAAAAGIAVVAVAAWLLLKQPWNRPPQPANPPVAVAGQPDKAPEQKAQETMAPEKTIPSTTVQEQPAVEQIVPMEPERVRNIPAAASVSEATMLLYDSTSSKEGLAMLDELIKKGEYKAAFLKSRLCFDPGKAGNKGMEFDYKWDQMRCNSKLPLDNKKAHDLLMDAYFMEHDQKDHELFYELGCDFLYMKKRGIADENEFKKARWCFERVKENTTDAAYLDAIKEKLKATASYEPVKP